MKTLDKQALISKTEEFIKEKLGKDSTGHDWWHIHRVRNNALNLAKLEGSDPFVVELTALLHDVADHKFHNGDVEAGPKAAREWLEQNHVDKAIIDQVCETIATLSFKGAGVKSQVPTREGQIVQDADRLDSMGAMGIARSFAYGGYKGRLMYDPNVKPEDHDTFEKYKNSTGPTINHFYEKLLLLKDLLNTESAKKIAQDRHVYMENFLEQFFAEWEGNR